MNSERLEQVSESRLWETLGAEVIEAGDGRAKVRYRGRPEWLLPSGRLQGGFVTAMIDSAMAVAIIGSIGPGLWHTTIELKVNFFRAAPLGAYTAEAQVLWKGKNVIHAEATLFSEDDNAVAKGMSTCMVLRHKDSE